MLNQTIYKVEAWFLGNYHNSSYPWGKMIYFFHRCGNYFPFQTEFTSLGYQNSNVCHPWIKCNRPWSLLIDLHFSSFPIWKLGSDTNCWTVKLYKSCSSFFNYWEKSKNPKRDCHSHILQSSHQLHFSISFYWLIHCQSDATRFGPSAGLAVYITMWKYYIFDNKIFWCETLIIINILLLLI